MTKRPQRLDEPFALPVDPKIDPDGPVFDAGPVSRMNAELVGMATKRRDPADVLLMQTFIARHGLRLVGFFPKVRAGKFLCNGPQRGLGLTRFPFGATTTKAGDRWVTPSEEARLRHYKPVPGEAAYAAQEQIRRDIGVYEARLSVQSTPMSLAEDKHSRLAWDSTTKTYRKFIPDSQKLPKDGKLPERHCQNPECLEDIEGLHHNTQYCNAKCTARAKELRRLDRKNQKAKRPILYRNESDVSADLTNDSRQLETGFISPHISRGIVSKDCQP